MSRRSSGAARSDLGKLSVMHLVQGYGEYLSGLHYSAQSVRVYSIYYRRALVAIAGLETVDVATLRAWWDTLPRSAASRNQARKAMLLFYKWRGDPSGGPAADLPQIPQPDRLPRAVSEADFLRLDAAASHLGGSHQLFYTLLAYTGCRISEARNARRRDFDLGAAPTWRIYGKGSNRRGPKERIIALHPHAAQLVADARPLDWLFPNRQGTGPLADTTIRGWMAEIAEVAGVEATAHQIRHTVATIGLARSKDIRAVQELLGHESLNTTQIYTKLTGDRVRDLVATLGPDAADLAARPVDVVDPTIPPPPPARGGPGTGSTAVGSPGPADRPGRTPRSAVG